jgi:dihydropteroate synthase
MQNFKMKFKDFDPVLGSETCIIGILNTTPDSFSDGGRFNSFDSALKQGLKLVEDGAHILDIGGESSRPFAKPVSEEEELSRVIPVIKALSKQIKAAISIDTVRASVARAALDAGASIINDISAFSRDENMAALAAKAKVPVILMHMKGKPEDMQNNPDYDDLMTEIRDYLAARAAFAIEQGVEKDKIILDPGIGFGKTVEHNLIIINHLNKIADLGFPVLVGPSRKSFIQKILSQGEECSVEADHIYTEYGTLAAAAISVIRGAHIVRVHDVEKAKAFFKVFDAISDYMPLKGFY